MKIETNYKNKVKELNAKYPSVKAIVKTGWNGRLEIEVSTVEKAKALSEMFCEFKFVSGLYIA